MAIEGVKPAIKLGRQPAQSLETDMLDLGLFCVIDCAQKKIPATNFKEMVAAVSEAPDQIPWKTIDKCFITLMATHDEIIRHEGKNNFLTPHVKKDRMEKISSYRIMITALFSIGEVPRNFLINKDAPATKNKAPAAIPALPPLEETTEQKEEGENNNNVSAPETPGNRTLI